MLLVAIGYGAWGSALLVASVIFARLRAGLVNWAPMGVGAGASLIVALFAALRSIQPPPFDARDALWILEIDRDLAKARLVAECAILLAGIFCALASRRRSALAGWGVGLVILTSGPIAVEGMLMARLQASEDELLPKANAEVQNAEKEFEKHRGRVVLVIDGRDKASNRAFWSAWADTSTLVGALEDELTPGGFGEFEGEQFALDGSEVLLIFRGDVDVICDQARDVIRRRARPPPGSHAILVFDHGAPERRVDLR